MQCEIFKKPLGAIVVKPFACPHPVEKSRYKSTSVAEVEVVAVFFFQHGADQEFKV